jgi:hypothetical protein
MWEGWNTGGETNNGTGWGMRLSALNEEQLVLRWVRD